MEYGVRLATPDDAAAVAGVLTASYPPLLAAAYDPELLARALPLMTRPHPHLLASGRYFIAEAQGRAIGCGGWSPERPDSQEVVDGVGHVRHFAVVADWIGHGVGRALYRRCEDQARVAGVRCFDAFSTLNGEPFYLALGFARVAPFDVAMGEGVALPSLLMRKPLG